MHDGGYDLKKLMLGNEAVARGAWEAGATVVVAYPGTPSTEITETAALYDEMYCEWSPNEKVALEVGVGASIGGARTMVCMKHVGVNVAADPLFTAAYTGVNGGLVIVVADDPGMHSSQNEQDSRYYAKAAHVPMLEPSSSQEAKDFVIKAFELSEEFDTPVFVRMVTRISHSQSVVECNERKDISLKKYVKEPSKYVMMPGMARKRHVVVEKRMNQLASEWNVKNIHKIKEGNSIGIITAGMVFQYVEEIAPEVSILKLGMVHPLPKELILDFVKDKEIVYVFEELEPVIENQLKVWGVNVKGKELLSHQGEYNARMLAKILNPKYNDGTPVIEELPARPPVMCAGCPHRGTFYVLNKLKVRVMGDIGCYTLGALPPLQAVDAVVCMGASIGMAHGMEKAMGQDSSKKTVAVIGDSTFFHSGLTGLVNVVYNSGCSTIMILDNSTTGMTGHQEHPGTGKNIRREVAPQLDITAIVKAMGIEDVATVDPFDLDGLEKVLKVSLNNEAPSVIIVKRPCALLSKAISEPCAIDQDKCRHCGMCLKLGCPAIENHDGKIIINYALCNGCGLCTNVCKFNAIDKETK